MSPQSRKRVRHAILIVGGLAACATAMVLLQRPPVHPDVITGMPLDMGLQRPAVAHVRRKASTLHVELHAERGLRESGVDPASRRRP